VEFDLRMAGDGTLVVLHDETVDRTTNGRGSLTEMSRIDLLRFDAGSWFHQRFAAARIPTLEEALLAIGPHARPVIELKAPVPAEKLLKSLRRFDLEGDAIVLSFEPAWLVPLRKASKELALGLLADEWSEELPARAKGLDAEVLGVDVDILSQGQIDAAGEKSLEVWTFTVNDIGMVAACAAMGVSGIITDRPDLIRTR
jgi:glycerophosphoryl diester phosphodiesterase